jgi:hypothetical protein
MRQMAYADGQIVAVGNLAPADLQYRAAAWRYLVDGDWDEVLTEQVGTGMDAVVRDGSGWVAVGTRGSPGVVPTELLTWRSSDGVAWEAPQVILSGGHLGVSALTLYENRILVFGWIPTIVDEREAWIPMILSGPAG